SNIFREARARADSVSNRSFDDEGASASPDLERPTANEQFNGPPNCMAVQTQHRCQLELARQLTAGGKLPALDCLQQGLLGLPPEGLSGAGRCRERNLFIHRGLTRGRRRAVTRQSFSCNAILVV